MLTFRGRGALAIAGPAQENGNSVGRTAGNVPDAFLEPGTAYDWEVLAIERSGSLTLSSASFMTG